jgi:hypothetical protein
LANNRYGEWLNNVIPCGALFNPAQVASNGPCVTGSGSLGRASPQSQAARQTAGAPAVTQLLGQVLPG